MNIVSFGFRSVDDTPITQPNLTPSKEIKSKRRTLEGTYYSRNKEKVRQYYLDNINRIREYSRQYYSKHKEELLWVVKSFMQIIKNILKNIGKETMKNIKLIIVFIHV